MQITEQDRTAARLEVQQATARSRMTDRQRQQLATLNAADRQRRLDHNTFVENFNKLSRDMYTMTRVLERLSTDRSDLERRALKLRRSLAQGLTVTQPHDLLFFASLTPDEESMHDS